MKRYVAYEHLTHPKYRADIDGLRAVAVLAVLGFHAFPARVWGGFVGVDVFFVISGFLISTIIFENLERGTFSFTEFYIRRIRRIFPSLLIVLSACLTIGWAVLLPDEFEQVAKHAFGGAGFVSNFVLWGEVGYFDNAAATKPLIHLWSLGIEEQFYLLWPLFLWVSWKRKWNLLLAISIVGAVSFAWNIRESHVNPSGDFYFPQTRFWELLIGAALAYLNLRRYEFPDLFAGSSAVRQALHDTLSVLGTGLISASVLFISDGAPYPGWRALLPTLGTAFIISATPQALINRYALSSRAVVCIGSISYPLYLWHWPLLSFAWIIEGQEPSLDIRLIALGLSFLLAWATVELIEKPIRFGRGGGMKAVALSSAMVFIGIIASAGYWHMGIEPRLRDGTHGIENVLKNWANRRAALAVRVDANCKDLLKNETDHLYCQMPSHTPTMLIVGDSHAIAFAQSPVRNRNPDIAVVASYSCLPMIGYATADPKESIEQQKKNCSTLMTSAVYLARTLPSIKSVILVARGGYEFKISSFDGAIDHTPDSSFVTGYAEAVETFQRLNKTVVFVLDVPDIGRDPTRCLDIRSIRLGLSTTAGENCALPIDIVRAHQRHYEDLVAQILARTTSLKVFDSKDALCDEDKCYGGRDTTVYYYDENHLSQAGSDLAFGAFARWLDRLR